MFEIIIKDFGDRAANHILQQLHFLNLNIKKIMITQDQEADVVEKLFDQLLKVKTEIVARIQELTDAAANGPSVSARLQTAIDKFAPVVQSLDDIVPDTVPVTEPAPEVPAVPVPGLPAETPVTEPVTEAPAASGPDGTADTTV